MRRIFRGIGLLALASLAAGCSTMGIYGADFACPASYNGRCVSVSEAHRLANKGEDNAQSDPVVIKGKKSDKAAETSPPIVIPNGAEVAQSQYKESLYKRLDSLVREPKAPIVAPAQVMRVLLLPYKGEGNELYMLRHVYFFVDDPKWVVSDTTAMDEEE